MDSGSDNLEAIFILVLTIIGIFFAFNFFNISFENFFFGLISSIPLFMESYWWVKIILIILLTLLYVGIIQLNENYFSFPIIVPNIIFGFVIISSSSVIGYNFS